ncbi:MAG: hypothetical protein ABIN96_02865 [Rubrivivax sp.]
MLSATSIDTTECNTDRNPDRSDLRQHLMQCGEARGRLHRLRCAAEAVNAFVAPRFVTTLGVATVLMLAALALLS